MNNPFAPAPRDHVFDLVEEVVRSGLILTDIFSAILEDLDDDAFPGENPAAVLIEMTAGSVRPAADAAGERVVREATALIGAVIDRTIDDLRTVAQLGDAA